MRLAGESNESRGDRGARRAGPARRRENESDTLSSVNKGVPKLPELGRLVARVPHRAPIDGHDGVDTHDTIAGGRGLLDEGVGDTLV